MMVDVALAIIRTEKYTLYLAIEVINVLHESYSDELIRKKLDWTCVRELVGNAEISVYDNFFDNIVKNETIGSLRKWSREQKLCTENEE